MTTRESYGYSAIVAEFLFILVPLLVLTLVFQYQGKAWVSLFASPEWAFASALLFGQTVMKFVTGIASAAPASKERVALFVSLLLVLGLIPAMLVLALILVSP